MLGAMLPGFQIPAGSCMVDRSQLLPLCDTAKDEALRATPAFNIPHSALQAQIAGIPTPGPPGPSTPRPRSPWPGKGCAPNGASRQPSYNGRGGKPGAAPAAATTLASLTPGAGPEPRLARAPSPRSGVLQRGARIQPRLARRALGCWELGDRPGRAALCSLPYNPA
ncbi:cleavage stimulation factor subunit 2 tau variant-like [Elephas maximus indicus]|uniref:cleavage stimulation factor subunit 2 tau variant-like n=1 Tax=Elephas maximus indicus TaxID=99487 RepID=UPI002115D68B|nr:cleavage stimulation factor subunit 2 tau variant-like [Elephas maximus indicus]